MDNDITVVKLENGSYQVSGNTFKHRETFKTLGGRWNQEIKSWILPSGVDLSIFTKPTKRISGLEGYKFREEIRKAGGKFDYATKEWIVPEDFVIEKPIIVREKVVRKCSYCHQPGHNKTSCNNLCNTCGRVGTHEINDCPMKRYHWGLFKNNKDFDCRCNENEVCSLCSNICCGKAVKAECDRPVGQCDSCYSCVKHGTRCINGHISDGW